MYSLLVYSAPGKGSDSTTTVTTIKLLLNISGSLNSNVTSLLEKWIMPADSQFSHVLCRETEVGTREGCRMIKELAQDLKWMIPLK